MKRYLLHSYPKSLIVSEDVGPRGGPSVEFFAIAQNGKARELKESMEGFMANLRKLSNGADPPDPERCLALLGLLTTNQKAYFLIVVTEVATIDLDRMKVQRVQKAKAIAIGDVAAGRQQTKKEEEEYREAVEAVNGVLVLLEDHFYFSYDFDVTQRLQRRGGGRGQVGMSTAEPRFLWNHFLCQGLVNQGVSEHWFTPVMQGFLQCHTLPGRSDSILLALLARRSCRHAGTRYNARGIDDDAEAANWVETEMLAKLPGEHWLSMTQVRGSAPVFWEQRSATSSVVASRGSRLTDLAFQRHQELLQEEYGEVFNVSLLSESTSKRETEGVLIEALKEQVRRSPQCRFKHLDLHARVTGEEEEFNKELEAVYREIGSQVEGFGFFDAQGSDKMTISRQQLGVLRTNCFDSLDRTNLLQYQVTWKWLASYIQQQPSLQGFMPAVSPTGGYSKSLAFFDMLSNEQVTLQALLRNMWADLGDALSQQYTGAASTMGATLRQGGHTTRAMLEKGWQAVNRAYMAHFEDGARQAAMQLLLRPKTPKVEMLVPLPRRGPQGKLLLAVASWNLHGQKCWEDEENLAGLIQGACQVNGEQMKPDVFVFCFQEFTELSASHVVLYASGDPELTQRFEALAAKQLAKQLGEDVVPVRSVGMVGLLISVFVRARWAPSVRAVSGERIRSGLYGQAGNKGAVAISFKVEETSICTASVHLESGQQGKKAQERADQLREILQGLCPDANRPDLMIVSGDFNFRAVLPSDGSTLRSTLSNGWPTTSRLGQVGEGALASTNEEVLRLFRQCDEMHYTAGRTRQELLEILKDFNLMEGPVNFPPTYRLLEGKAAYDLERQPAWCDRVLHSKVSVQRKSYCALGALKQSDHRPVCALIETLLLAMPEAGRKESLRASTSPSAAMPDLLNLLESNVKPVTPQAETPESSTRAEELLDFDASPVTPCTPLTPVPAPPAAPAAPVPPGTGPAATAPTATQMGQLVYAKYQDGWYLANVIRPGSGTVDVAWLRPHGAVWGDKAQMAQYLCSTNADETLHGDKLPVATHIRLPSERAENVLGSSDLIDLLG